MALHTSTIISHSSKPILSHLSKLSSAFPSHSILFALSSNAPSADLQVLVSRLQSLSSSTTLGCLSSALPGHTDSISCSLAVFDPASSVPFRSTIRGREAPQVGRWHNFRLKDEGKINTEAPPGMEDGLKESVNWDEVWDRSAGDNQLPSDLQRLRPEDVNSVVYFSDKAPEGLSNSLTSLPSATKLGLIASSTPFITGRPVTLFHNGDIHSSGAVGYALTGRRKPQSSIEFPGLRAITPPLKVTRSEGNLVNELDGGNPSKLLLAAIRKHDIQAHGSLKEDDFYLGAFQDDQLNQVYHITSGDPSRGTIALESHAAPAEGTVVQLYHRPSTIPTGIPARYTQKSTQTSQKSLSFMASSFDIPTPASNQKDESHAILGSFIASSENGFSLSRSLDGVSEGAWRCTVAGGLAALEWQSGEKV